MQHFVDAKYLVVFVSQKLDTLDEEYIELDQLLEKEAEKIDGFLGLQYV